MEEFIGAIFTLIFWVGIILIAVFIFIPETRPAFINNLIRYQDKYVGEYSEENEEEFSLSLSYNKEADTFEATFNSSEYKIIFIKESDYTYKSTNNDLQLYLKLDGRKGHKIFLIDKSDIISLLKI